MTTSAPSGIVDVHTHFVPRGWPHLGADRPWLRIDSERDAMIMIRSSEFRRIGANSWNPELRLTEMDADGVAAQVVSPTPVFFSYDASGAQGERIAGIFNDAALAICASAPSRLLPFCQVPLQDSDAACRELDRATANGHVGVEIGNHVGDRDLDDAGVVTFLQHAAERGVPVFVHPWDLPTSPRIERWMAQWLAGMPAETHLSILAMILGGVFDKITAKLRICFAHGGGSFPFWLGRFENAWHNRADVIATSQEPPSAYLGRFSVDSVVFAPAALRLLVDVIGPSHIMIGSDYPYPLGERPVGNVIDQADFLTAEQKHAIRRGNAERFLGLHATDQAGALETLGSRT